VIADAALAMSTNEYPNSTRTWQNGSRWGPGVAVGGFFADRQIWRHPLSASTFKGCKRQGWLKSVGKELELGYHLLHLKSLNV
jgi:hypothetical protein